MVIVNTVVLIRANLGLGESEVAITLGLFGAGSMLAAFALPTLLDRFSDRSLMLFGATLMTATLIVFAVVVHLLGLSWAGVLVAWLMTGIGYSAVLTPSGRLLRRSAHAQNRPSLFAAQFALSHACWLVTYPLAGWVMTQAGLVPALLVLGGLSVVGIGVALFIWPRSDSDILEHRHDSLPEDHPHVKEGRTHAHAFVIDDEHIRWSAHL
jgi:MFS family permease